MTALGAWARERMRPRLFAPAIGALALAALWAAGARPSIGRTLAVVVLTALLVAGYRLWDDLEDRANDAVRHPGRVLPRHPAAPFVVAVAVMAIAALALAAWLSPAAAAALALLDAAFLTAYRLRPGLPDSVWRYGLLPLKYPAFVLVALFAAGAAPAVSARGALVTLVVFLAAVGYEAWHTALPAARSTS